MQKLLFWSKDAIKKMIKMSYNEFFACDITKMDSYLLAVEQVKSIG